MLKFYKCKVCNNLINVVLDGGGPLECCGRGMSELTANTVDASLEKHVPSVKVSGSNVAVQVGSVAHPMEQAHHINFICLETKTGAQFARLQVDGRPNAEFMLASGESAVAVYEYCNLHGLWKKELI